MVHRNALYRLNYQMQSGSLQLFTHSVCVWSVLSVSLWTRRLYPPRLLCQWDFPGTDTGVGRHFLLQGVFLTQGWKLHLLGLLHWQEGSLLIQGSPPPTLCAGALSRVGLFHPIDCSPPGSSAHRIFHWPPVHFPPFSAETNQAALGWWCHLVLWSCKRPLHCFINDLFPSQSLFPWCSFPLPHTLSIWMDRTHASPLLLQLRQAAQGV